MRFVLQFSPTMGLVKCQKNFIHASECKSLDDKIKMLGSLVKQPVKNFLNLEEFLLVVKVETPVTVVVGVADPTLGEEFDLVVYWH